MLFDGARFTRTSQAVVIKSLPSFVGTASNITYQNFVLDGVKTAVMINVSSLPPVSASVPFRVSALKAVTAALTVGRSTTKGGMVLRR